MENPGFTLFQLVELEEALEQRAHDLRFAAHARAPVPASTPGAGMEVRRREAAERCEELVRQVRAWRAVT